MQFRRLGGPLCLISIGLRTAGYWKKNVGRETREQNFSCSANSTDGQFVLCTGPLTAPRWCLLPRRYLRTFEGYLPYILFLFRRRTLLSIHLGLLLVVY